jgi:hypothetical protein
MRDGGHQDDKPPVGTVVHVPSYFSGHPGSDTGRAAGRSLAAEYVHLLTTNSGFGLYVQSVQVPGTWHKRARYRALAHRVVSTRSPTILLTN